MKLASATNADTIETPCLRAKYGGSFLLHCFQTWNWPVNYSNCKTTAAVRQRLNLRNSEAWGITAVRGVEGLSTYTCSCIHTLFHDITGSYPMVENWSWFIIPPLSRKHAMFNTVLVALSVCCKLHLMAIHTIRRCWPVWNCSWFFRQVNHDL